MIPLKVALRNVFRHQTRSLITLSAIVSGCVSVIFVGGYFEDVFFKMRESYIKAHTGHLQVYREGFFEKGAAEPFEYLIKNPQEIISLIRGIPGVQAVTRRIEFAGLVSTGDNTVSCVGQGIEPAHEPTAYASESFTYSRRRQASSIFGSTIIESGEPLQEESELAVLLGKGLARGLGAKAGDGLIIVSNTVGGSINALDVTLKGTFFTSAKAFDDHFLRIPFATAQKLLHTDGVQSLVILLEKTEDTRRVQEEIQRLARQKNLPLETKRWDELNDFYTKTQDLFQRFFIILKGVVALIVILSIFNTMNMAVLERTVEIGTIMALGTRRRGVLSLFLIEGAALGAIGGAVGVVAGIVVTQIVSQVGIPMPPPPGATILWLSEPMIVPSAIAFAFGLSIATAVVSSLYPAYKASRLEIAQALRHTG